MTKSPLNTGFSRPRRRQHETASPAGFSAAVPWLSVPAVSRPRAKRSSDAGPAATHLPTAPDPAGAAVLAVAAADRPAEEDEPVVDEGVHEPHVLVPAVGGAATGSARRA